MAEEQQLRFNKVSVFDSVAAAVTGPHDVVVRDGLIASVMARPVSVALPNPVSCAGTTWISGSGQSTTP